MMTGLRLFTLAFLASWSAKPLPFLLYYIISFRPCPWDKCSHKLNGCCNGSKLINNQGFSHTILMDKPSPSFGQIIHLIRSCTDEWKV